MYTITDNGQQVNKQNYAGQTSAIKKALLGAYLVVISSLSKSPQVNYSGFLFPEFIANNHGNISSDFMRPHFIKLQLAAIAVLVFALGAHTALWLVGHWLSSFVMLSAHNAE